MSRIKLFAALGSQWKNQETQYYKRNQWGIMLKARKTHALFKGTIHKDLNLQVPNGDNW
jgi:hypothetical protein